jgi:hypothetical protein
MHVQVLALCTVVQLCVAIASSKQVLSYGNVLIVKNRSQKLLGSTSVLDSVA